jgi:hypothetical protein
LPLPLLDSDSRLRFLSVGFFDRIHYPGRILIPLVGIMAGELAAICEHAFTSNALNPLAGEIVAFFELLQYAFISSVVSLPSPSTAVEVPTDRECAKPIHDRRSARQPTHRTSPSCLSPVGRVWMFAICVPVPSISAFWLEWRGRRPV